jgi:uncharacterized protein YdcH (DUF465 family)
MQASLAVTSCGRFRTFLSRWSNAQAARSSHRAIPSKSSRNRWRGIVAPPCLRSMQRGGQLMFEHNEKEIEALMQSNSEFRTLYQRHKELDGKVRDAELGVLPIDDVTLHNMKKEKLRAKDILTSMWEHSRPPATH